MGQFWPTSERAPRMILTCPSCSTRYQADSTRFARPGRNVRCAKCGHVWFQTAPEAEPEPEPVLAPPPQTMPNPRFSAPDSSTPSLEGAKPAQPPSSSPPPKRKRARNAMLADAVGWAALIFLAVTIGWAGVQYRQ